MKVKTLLVSAFLISATQFAFAQESARYGLPKNKDFDKWSAGLTVGLNWFQGDLNEKTGNNNSILNNIQDPVFGLKVGYQIATHNS